MADPAELSKAVAAIDQVHKTLDRKDHFELLGVDLDTDAETLKRAFHLQAKRWHTDNFAGMELGRRKPKLDEIFQRLNEAYDTLSDDKLRGEYLILRKRKQDGLSTDVNSILRAEALLDDGLSELRKKQWKAALDHLTEAQSLNPDDPLYDVHIAWATYNDKRNDKAATTKAEDLLARALKKQESLPLAYQYLGQIAFNREDYDMARRWWKKCLEWDKKNVEVMRGIRLINTRAAKKDKSLGAIFGRLFAKKK
jgi:curved DNA-binding protein CbpA